MVKSSDWITTARKLLDTGVVLVCISATRGSTPLPAGAWMLVSQSQSIGSVGGGRLEEVALEQSRQMMRDGCHQPQSMSWVLGTSLGQCCGGRVDVLFWPLTAGDRHWLQQAQDLVQDGKEGYCLLPNTGGIETRDNVQIVRDVHATDGVPALWSNPDYTRLEIRDTRPQLVVFGAGHVGRHVAALATQLPIRVLIFDQRAEEMSKLTTAENIQSEVVVDIVATVDRLPAESCVLVMTHLHSLDCLLVKALLQRDDIAWVGLIGSQSKACHFMTLLRKQGVDEQALQRLQCPIGIDTQATQAQDTASIAFEILFQAQRMLTARHKQNERSGVQKTVGKQLMQHKIGMTTE